MSPEGPAYEHPPTPSTQRLSWNDGIRGEQVLPLINKDGAVLRVEAGPGTGKTFGLVRRVERIVHSEGLDVAGEEVLVVAFNRVIAKDLQNAVDARLANIPHHSNPEIRTVHALCLKVIGGDLRLLMDHEREAMLYDVLTLNPAIRARLNRHSAVEQALENHEAKHVEDIELWQAVFRWLTRHQARLISELPGLLLDGIRQGDYADLQYQHVIVDEFQDLTPGEQELFFKLRRSGGQFVALGDPRQSIYAFRGNDRGGLAKLDAMASAQGESVQNISLPECQRCPAPVVVAANTLMTQYPPPMTGGSDEQANVHLVRWDSPADEAQGMARAILDNIRQHPEERHLAMVTRRKFGYWLRDQLLRLDPDLGIDLSFSESMLETWAVREAFIFASLLIGPDPAMWRAWFAYKTATTGEDYKPPYRNSDAYLKWLTTKRDTIEKAAVRELAASARQPPGQGGKNLLERAKRFCELERAINYPPVDPSAFVDELFASERWVSAEYKDSETAKADLSLLIEKLKAIIRERKEERPEAEPADLIEYAMAQVRYQIATREPFVPRPGVQLQVTTLWGAKGVTSEHVYILGLCDEAIPGEYREEYPGTREDFVEEQRRLLYVSLTRARKTLVLSRATGVPIGEAKRIGLSIRPDQQNRGFPKLFGCRFLGDILSHLPESVKGREWHGCVLRG